MSAIILLLGLGEVVQTARPHLNSKADLRCGAYCLYVAMKAMDLPVFSFKQLEAKLGEPTQMGYSMQRLSEVASMFNAHTLGVNTSLDHLERRSERFACIALLQHSGHYICIYDINDSNVYIIDPPNQRVMSRSAFAKLWSGKALLVSDRPLTRLHVSRWYSVLAVFATLIVIVSVGWMLFRGIRSRR